MKKTILFRLLLTFTCLILIFDNLKAQGPGNAMVFDGIDDYIVIPTISKPIYGSAASFETWFKTSQTTQGMLLQNLAGMDMGLYLNRYNKGKVLPFIDASTAGESTDFGNNLNDDKWHHFILIYNNGSVSIYIDGIKVGSKNETISTGIASNGYLGSNGGSFIFYQGLLDEVRTWNQALTEKQLREYMHLSQPKNSGITGYWTFDEASGNTIYDSSNTKNNGTLQNGVSRATSSVPLGKGVSASQKVLSSGFYNFQGTGVSMDFKSISGSSDFVLTKINTLPSGKQLTNNKVINSYWILNQFSGSSFSADISITLAPNSITMKEACNLKQIKLYRRNTNDDGNWTFIKTADSADAFDNRIVFTGISSNGQYVIGIDPSTDVLDFNTAGICARSKVNFTNISSGQYVSYRWNFGDGNSSSNSNPTHTYSSPGKYKVTLTGIFTNCFDTISKFILINPTPVVNFDIKNVCLGESLQFNNQTTYSGIENLIYQWAFGDGQFSTLKEPVHNYSSPGTYKVSLSVKSSNSSCVDTISKFIKIFNIPKANFTVLDVCDRNAVQFNNYSNIAGNEPLNYLWRFGDGNTSTLIQPSHLYNSFGNFTVTLIAISNNGCKDSVTHSVNIYPVPVAEFDVSNLCLGEAVNFQNKFVYPGTDTLTFAWDFSDGNTSVLESPTHIFSDSGNYQVKLIVKTKNNCVDSIIKNIKITAPPKIFFSANPLNPFTYKFIPSDSTGISYSWDFGDGNTSTNKSPTHLYSDTGSYFVSLKMINDNDCESIAYDTILIKTTGVNFKDQNKNNEIIKIKPNPFTDNIQVIYNLKTNGNIMIDIFDLNGKKIYSKQENSLEAGSNNILINLSSIRLTNGIYILKSNINGKLSQEKIIKL